MPTELDPMLWRGLRPAEITEQHTIHVGIYFYSRNSTIASSETPTGKSLSNSLFFRNMCHTVSLAFTHTRTHNKLGLQSNQCAIYAIHIFNQRIALGKLFHYSGYFRSNRSSDTVLKLLRLNVCWSAPTIVYSIESSQFPDRIWAHHSYIHLTVTTFSTEYVIQFKIIFHSKRMIRKWNVKKKPQFIIVWWFWIFYLYRNSQWTRIGSCSKA